MSHSPEPWVVEKLPNSTIIADARGDVIARVTVNDDPVTPEVAAANAERIRACVNACRGIPTEALRALATGGSITLLGRPSELRSVTITNDLPAQTDQTKQNVETKKF